MPKPTANYLSSPYNFVPLADSVFLPEWGEPSHDCPYADAVSGRLQLTLTAKSPIYVRGSDPKPEKKSDLLWGQHAPADLTPFGKWTGFYRDPTTGKYAIPGTTVKGMIRNVLKIASFGSIAYADDDFISVRDLNDPKYTTQITRPGPKNSFEAKVRAGWLSENPSRRSDDPEWIITPCKLARVEQCKRHPTDPDGLEQSAALGNMALGKAMLPAKGKYSVWDRKFPDRTIRFDLQMTGYDDGFDLHPHSCGRLFYAKAINLGTGGKTGTLVFTGQSGPREGLNKKTGNWERKGGSKHMEFIFYADETRSLPVSPATQKKFKDTHPDDNEGWKYWRQKLHTPNGRVPVFWIENLAAAKPEETVVSFGLAQMFRLPARNLHDAIPPQHKQKGALDAADRLFGFVRDTDALRGRVAFGALALLQKNDEVRFSRVIQTVLGAPRPTFYPAYLEQPAYSLPAGRLRDGKDVTGNTIRAQDAYKTWLSPEVRIRGWKRYWVVDAPQGNRESIRREHPIPKRRNKQGGWEPNYDVATAFRPVTADAKFSGSCVFHNLTRRELGALVWALTWGGDTALRHSLGMGKSLGMGSCVIEIDWNKSELVWSGDPACEYTKQVEQAKENAEKRKAFIADCQTSFADDMNEFTNRQLSPEVQRGPWLETRAMTELRAMADPANAAKLDAHKQFPPLRSSQLDVADFREIKTRALVLPRTTEIITGRPVQDRQTASGNPPLSPRETGESESPELETPAVAPVRTPPAILKDGQPVSAPANAGGTIAPASGPHNLVGQERQFRFAGRNKKGNPLFEIQWEGRTYPASLARKEAIASLPSDLSKETRLPRFKILRFENGRFTLGMSSSVESDGVQ